MKKTPHLIGRHIIFYLNNEEDYIRGEITDITLLEEGKKLKINLNRATKAYADRRSTEEVKGLSYEFAVQPSATFTALGEAICFNATKGSFNCIWIP